MLLYQSKNQAGRRIVSSDPSVRAMMRSMTEPSHETSTDEALMLAYKDGQLAAFETLYHRHKAPLYRFILRHGIDKPSAEELLQEVWSSVIKGRIKYQPSAKFTTWLYTIARNRLIDFYRGKKEHVQLLDDDLAMLEDTSEPTGQIRDAAFNKIRQVIASLPFPQRQAFLLHYEAGLSVPDIANINQEHVDAVKSRIRYAVEKLQQRLGGHDE